MIILNRDQITDQDKIRYRDLKEVKTNNDKHDKILLKQYDDGQIVEPYSISAGLDYPGIGPIHAHLYKSGRELFYNVTDEFIVPFSPYTSMSCDTNSPYFIQWLDGFYPDRVYKFQLKLFNYFIQYRC